MPFRLTNSGRTKLRKPDHLNWYVRVLVGLLHSGFSIIEAAKVLRAERSVVESFWNRLLATDNPALQDALTRPQTALAAELPYSQKVHCGKCNSQLTVVPCVYCSLQEANETELDPDAEEWGDSMEYRALEPAAPTNALPGTLGKLRVMEERVSRGESPFHEDDLLCYPDR